MDGHGNHLEGHTALADYTVDCDEYLILDISTSGSDRATLVATSVIGRTR
jgi:hypothetical protein